MTLEKSELNLLAIGGSTFLGNLKNPSFISLACGMKKELAITTIIEPNITVGRALNLVQQLTDFDFDFCLLQLGSGDSLRINRILKHRKSDVHPSRFIKWIPFLSCPRTSIAEYQMECESLIKLLNKHSIPVIWISTLIGKSRHTRYRNLRQLYCVEMPKFKFSKLSKIIDLNKLLSKWEVARDKAHPNYLGHQKIWETLKNEVISKL